MVFSSKLIEDAVDALCRLPGIGKKTALRLALHLLKEDRDRVIQCNNISDGGLCNICNNPLRDKQTIMVVENLRDVISIESTGQFNGTYHVLGGLLSPLDGIGPDQLYLQNLASRIEKNKVKEIIMALNPTIEGDTTVYYIHRQIHHLEVMVTGIARGVAFGSELEYTDDVTLARSIAKRLPVDAYVKTAEYQKDIII
jgi:recombination protein RecR